MPPAVPSAAECTLYSRCYAGDAQAVHLLVPQFYPPRWPSYSAGGSVAAQDADAPVAGWVFYVDEIPGDALWLRDQEGLPSVRNTLRNRGIRLGTCERQRAWHYPLGLLSKCFAYAVQVPRECRLSTLRTLGLTMQMLKVDKANATRVPRGCYGFS
jgi:hypothetical protein